MIVADVSDVVTLWWFYTNSFDKALSTVIAIITVINYDRGHLVRNLINVRNQLQLELSVDVHLQTEGLVLDTF